MHGVGSGMIMDGWSKEGDAVLLFQRNDLVWVCKSKKNRENWSSPEWCCVLVMYGHCNDEISK